MMEKSSVCILLFFIGLSAVLGSICKSGAQPKLKVSNLYTTTDASVLTSIAYVAQFELNCDKDDLVPVNLYADVNNGQKLLQVARNGKQFQVSWSEEISKSTNGDHVIRILDEEMLTVARKAKSWTSPEIKPIADLKLNHPGAYSGPWLSSEHLAAILGVFVAYIALRSKSNF